MQPTWQPVSVREGSEPDIFWDALGRRSEYPREKETKKFVEDPHLFTCILAEGRKKILSFAIYTSNGNVVLLGIKSIQAVNGCKSCLIWGVGSFRAWTLSFLRSSQGTRPVYHTLCK